MVRITISRGILMAVAVACVLAGCSQKPKPTSRTDGALDKVLTLFNEGKKDEAVAELLAIDWGGAVQPPASSFWTMTESQAAQLPQDGKDAMMKELSQWRDLARYAMEAGNRSGDSSVRDRHAQAVKSLGSFICSDPNRPTLALMVGKAIQKYATAGG